MIIALFLSFLMGSTEVLAKSGESSGGKGGGHYGITLAPNVPHVYDIAYETLNRGSHFTYSLSAGYIPPITISTASVSTFNVEARARWHPFGGAFFFGMGTGFQNYTGSGSQSITVGGQSVPVTLKDTVSGIYFTPHMGWLWIFGRFLVGLEAGIQTGGDTNKLAITINDPTLQSQLAQVQADPTYKTFENTINDAVKTLTQLPYVGLKLGWSF